MITGLQQMDPNATVVLLTTAGALREFFTGLTGESKATEPEREHQQPEVTKEQARKILIEKGYRVRSEVWLMKVLGDHDIIGKQRGRRLWFDAEVIRNIPDIK